MLHGHGDDIYGYPEIRANFSSNVWYGADLSGLRLHLQKASAALSSYPEPDAATLGRRLAAHRGIAPESVCVTNGATEAFYLIAQAFRGFTSVIAQPSFSEYGDACRIYAHRIIEVGQEELTAGKFALPEKALVWLCTPNNPDGRTTPPDVVEKLAAANPECTFVIDLAYEAFTKQPLPEPTDKNRQLVFVCSMTKQYGIAGLRLGYIAAHPEVMRQIAAIRMPWSVNTLAIAAGNYILDHPQEFLLPLDGLLRETERFRDNIGKIEGVATEPTHCHFFTGRLTKGRAAELKEVLVRNHGLLIRDASNFRGYGEGAFRMATQQPEHNDLLTETIRQWVRRQG